MADNTKIEWTDATWNPVTGCSVLSPGCTNCYAMKLAGTRMKHHESRAGLTVDTKAGPVWNGEVRFNEQWLTQPLQWKKPRMIFVCAHADLFHESVPDAWIDRVFAVMALAPQHTFQVLTKRSKRMREYIDKAVGRIADAVMALRRETGIGKGNPLAPLPHIKLCAAWWPLPNVWLGVSVEDQKRADERIPDLLATPAAVRWISAEPLLGPVDISSYMWPVHPWWEAGKGYRNYDEAKAAGAKCGHKRQALVGAWCKFLDWGVAGGESGANARPMHPDWARSLRDQCAAAGVPFLFKQWGEYHPADQTKTGDQLTKAGGMGTAIRDGLAFQFVDQWTWRIGKTAAGRLLDGVEHNGYPVIGDSNG